MKDKGPYLILVLMLVIFAVATCEGAAMFHEMNRP